MIHPKSAVQVLAGREANHDIQNPAATSGVVCHVEFKAVSRHLVHADVQPQEVHGVPPRHVRGRRPPRPEPRTLWEGA
ncbi:hypothetical protein ACOMHN_066761 [Nucella lapillus]